MSNASDFSVGLVHDFTIAAAAAGLTPDDFVKCSQERKLLEDLRKVLRGQAEVTCPEHVIDLDSDPFLPQGWTVEAHQKSGQWKFDPKEVEFFLAKGQKGGKVVEGNKLRKELADKRVMNANVLDYLLANPHLIPEDWKKDEKGQTRYIFFWGTVYRNSGGYLYVRYLYWVGDRWRWGDGWLGDGWNDGGPAALRAS